MTVEPNPLLPEANAAGGIETQWAGDDQQWWDWYVTLAENPPSLGRWSTDQVCPTWNRPRTSRSARRWPSRTP